MYQFQPQSSNSTASSQTYWKSAFLLVLVSILTLATSCANKDKPIEPIDGPIQEGIISTYNEYDGAMFDFTKEDMDKAGFTLGDLVSITLDGKTFDVPYYDGYYSRRAKRLMSSIA